jgi:hypothetical protein
VTGSSDPNGWNYVAVIAQLWRHLLRLRGATRVLCFDLELDYIALGSTLKTEPPIAFRAAYQLFLQSFVVTIQT